MTTETGQTGYTLVVGLGKTGLSVVRHLHGIGEHVVVMDSRDIPPGYAELQRDYPQLDVHTGGFDQACINDAARIILSPGVSLRVPALAAAADAGIEIVGDIDMFARLAQAPIIAITGSNGKSTVTELLASMARKSGIDAIACGNIGLPVLDALDAEAGMYVVELSSFQLETVQQLQALTAVVLNISADHLDRYDDLAHYAASKQRIYRHAANCVINLDDAIASDTGESACNRICFTLGASASNSFGIDGDHVAYQGEALIAIDDIHIKGRHNLQNVMAALALGMTAGLDMDHMLETLKEFSGLAHRMQHVAAIGGVDWYNDSKATNVGAAIASLTGVDGRHVLIAGGIAKDADFTPLTDIVSKHCRAVVLFGRDAELLRAAMPTGTTVEMVADMAAAVAAARRLAQQGDNVILAPACASFDMFDNFEHRGDVFAAEVRGLQS